MPSRRKGTLRWASGLVLRPRDGNRAIYRAVRALTTDAADSITTRSACQHIAPPINASRRTLLDHSGHRAHWQHRLQVDPPFCRWRPRTNFEFTRPQLLKCSPLEVIDAGRTLTSVGISGPDRRGDVQFYSVPTRNRTDVYRLSVCHAVVNCVSSAWSRAIECGPMEPFGRTQGTKGHKADPRSWPGLSSRG